MTRDRETGLRSAALLLGHGRRRLSYRFGHLARMPFMRCTASSSAFRKPGRGYEQLLLRLILGGCS